MLSQMSDDTTNSRDPFLSKPSRLPGQSLSNRIDDLRSDVGFDFATVALLFLLCAFEWARYAWKIPPQPVALALGGSLLAALILRGTWSNYQELLHCRQGHTGELLVAQVLEELRPDGYRVLHDMQAHGFNVDHVIVGPAGVFAIETKTLKKPRRGSPTIVYDGKTLAFPNKSSSNSAIHQAADEARWLSGLIEQRTGKKFPVHAVVIYVDWYVKENISNPAVWVLNQKLFQGKLKNMPQTLPNDDISLISATLTDYNSTPRG